MPLQENFEKYVSCCLYVLRYFNIICETCASLDYKQTYGIYNAASVV
jgi:hypothetical protein